MKRLSFFIAATLACTLLAGPGQQALLTVKTPAGGGGGSATFSDTFTGVLESPISTNWDTGFTGWSSGSRNSGVAVGSGGSWLIRVKTATATFAANQEASTTIVSGSDGFVGPAVRIQTGDGSCYALAQWGSGSLRIIKFTGASAAGIGADYTITPLIAGDVIKLKATGTGTVTLEAFINGVSVGTARTDSTSPYNSGQPGVWGGDSISADVFQADDV